MSHESIQIHLNSKFAKTFNNLYYSDVDFETNLIQVDDRYSIHLSVINASIPYSFYNINTTNNKLTFHEYISGTSRGLTLYIEEGNYTAYQLATYLSQNLPNTTVSYNSITNKFTFTNPVNDFIEINSSNSEKIDFVLMNSQGQKIQSGSFTNQIKLNISALNSGIYFLEMNSSKAKTVKKVVKL